jgi:hypothetical protein
MKRRVIGLLKRLSILNYPTPLCHLDSCGCHQSSFTWCSYDDGYVWYETPKCASRSIKEMFPNIQLSLAPPAFIKGATGCHSEL